MFDKYFLSSLLPVWWRLGNRIPRLSRWYAGTDYPHLIAGENMYIKATSLTFFPAFNGHGNRPVALVMTRMIIRDVLRVYPCVRIGGPGDFCRQPRAPDIRHHHTAEAASAAVGVSTWPAVAIRLHRNDGVRTVIVEV